MAPVVRFGGVFSRSADAALECKARGVDGEQPLTSLYVQELHQLLRARGFRPMGDDLIALLRQRHVVDLLLLWAANVDTNADADADDVLHPATLQRAQLARKELEGRLVDDNYAFGRRFLSVATFVATWSREELLRAATARNVELPKLDDQERAAVKVHDRELLRVYDTAQGRPLKSLTLRQLVTEVEARGMRGPGDTARDTKGKRCKRAWVALLRPVMVAEVRALKIREQEEEMLRTKMVGELEREQERKQQLRVVQLIEAMIRQTDDRNGTCAEPEDDDAILRQECREVWDKKSRGRHEMRTFLTSLAKSVCVRNDGHGDIPMNE